MKEVRVWIDDVRPMPDGFDLWAKNSKEFFNILSKYKIVYISFDHDLGDSDLNGYEIASRLELMTAHGYFTHVINYDVHSLNPVGSERIKKAMDSARRLIETNYKCFYGTE